MEPRIYLTALVLAVGVLHLVWKLVDVVKSYYAASGRKGLITQKAAVKRDDWYMFFYCSDLTGVKKKNGDQRANNKTSYSKGPGLRRESRLTANRYMN